MKIKRLYIKEYQQFKDVEFIFNDHKNCIIGQSGTGKTTLLNLIYSFINILSGKNINYNFNEGIFEFDFELNGTLFKVKNNKIDFINHLFSYKGFLNSIKGLDEKIHSYISILYVTNELGFHEPFFQLKINTEKPVVKTVYEPHIQYEIKSNTPKIKDHNIICLDKSYDYQFYASLLSSIISFDSELLNKFSSSGISDINELIKWRDNNNPRKKIADECLNGMLKEFHLVMDPSITDNYITIKHSSGERIAPIQLSTGTKQIILSSLPIYLLRENLSIVLFDEPERSLFPDIQKLLPDHYTSLAPDAQFFFVTHSPFFAAGFNEDERINLYFNDAGYVTQDTVTKGFSPRGDDANDMLFNDFKVSSMNEYGLKMHKRYLELNNEADYQLAQGLTVDKKLLKEIREPGDKYNF